MIDDPPARLLIVDDETAQMEALCNTLRDRGYETVGFSVPSAALDALRGSKFDLLLTDLMMPEIDGIGLLRAASALDPDLVVILMTGQGTIDTAVEAMKAGALDYILKPFKLSVVLPVISRALAVRNLRLKNAELERGLRQRTSELEAANKELETFSYSVSHDLRTPLRAVNGFCGILKQRYAEQLPAMAMDLLEQAIEGSRRMNDLIEDLLRLSQLGRKPLSRIPVDLASMFREVADELRGDIGPRTVELAVADLPPCVGDASLLRQVAVNLLANAFKYTRTRERAVIEVGCERNGTETVFFIRDNGVGFNMNYAGKLFGVFQRLHQASEFEGTGVGLSIVQRIVHRHGGRIWAEAVENQGATFRFTLPN